MRVIVLKNTEISNAYGVYQEVTQYGRSIILQEQMNKQANSQKKTSDLYFSESEKWNLMKAIKTHKLSVIKK